MSFLINPMTKGAYSEYAGKAFQAVSGKVKQILGASRGEVVQGTGSIPTLMPRRDCFIHGNKVIYAGTRKKTYVKPKVRLLSENESKEILHNEKQKELENLFRGDRHYYNPKTDKSIFTTRNGVRILKGKHSYIYDGNYKEIPYERDITWNGNYTLITEMSGKQKVYDGAKLIEPDIYFKHRDVPYYYAKVEGYLNKDLKKIFPSLKDRIVWEARGY